MTPEGRLRLLLVESYGLGKYYQEHCGNLIIPYHDFVDLPTVRRNVMRLLTECPEWLLGVEDLDPSETPVVYLNTLEDLKNW